MRTLVWLFAGIIVLTGALGYGVWQKDASWAPRLGLDLAGGTQIVLEPRVEGGGTVSQQQLAEARDIIVQRIDSQGTTGAEVTTQGDSNIVVAMPVFFEGKIIAWTANIAHNSDIGGMAPGSLSGEATEIFQEGLRLPAVKLVSKSEPIKPVFEIMKVNSRMPDFLEGDVWAAIASVRIGARRLSELAEKYGVDTFERAMSATPNST